MEDKSYPEEGQKEEKSFQSLMKKNLSNPPSISIAKNQLILNKNSFSNSERLKNKRSLDLLFNNGISFRQNSIKVIFLKQGLTSKDIFPVELAVSIPKKIVRLSVKRNKIKRLIKEAYRINKHELYSHLAKKGVKISILFIFLGKEIPDFLLLKQTILKIIFRLKENI